MCRECVCNNTVKLCFSVNLAGIGRTAWNSTACSGLKKYIQNTLSINSTSQTLFSVEENLLRGAMCTHLFWVACVDKTFPWKCGPDSWDPKLFLLLQTADSNKVFYLEWKLSLFTGPLRWQYCHLKIFSRTLAFAIFITLGYGGGCRNPTSVHEYHSCLWVKHLLETEKKMNFYGKLPSLEPKSSKTSGFLVVGPKSESNIPHAEQLHYFSGISQNR